MAAGLYNSDFCYLPYLILTYFSRCGYLHITIVISIVKDVCLAKNKNPTKLLKTNSIRPLRFSNSIFLILLFLTQAVLSSNLNVTGSGNYYPYYIDNKSNPGILQIIKQVMLLADIQVQHVELKRTVKYLHQGHIDFDVISPEWLSQTEKQNPQFSYSNTLFAVEEYLVSLKSVAQWQNSTVFVINP